MVIIQKKFANSQKVQTLEGYGKNQCVPNMLLEQLLSSNPAALQEVIENDDLLQQILLHLPAKSLFKFKLVATRWRYIISDPNLLRLWKPKSVTGLFFVTNWHSYYPIYNFITLDHSNLIKSTISMMHCKRLTTVENPRGISIVQSCNGLLLCCSNYRNRRFSTCDYYIYNPTTNQMKCLPRLENSDKKMTMGISLAFDPERHYSHYKVIRVCNDESSWDLYHIEVYSSETGTWTQPGESFSYDNLILHDGVYWEGKIVWLSLPSESFFYYDIDKGQFQKMPKPPIEDQWRHYRIKYFGAWRGKLNFIRYSNGGKMKIYIFELEKDESKWVLKYHDEGFEILRDYPQLFGNRVMFSSNFFSILSFIPGDSVEDSDLIFYIPGNVVSYNLKEKMIRKRGELMLDFDDQHALSTLGWIDVHQYIETFAQI